MKLFWTPQTRSLRVIWMLGAQFTAADVMLGSSAIFLRQFDMLPDTRNIGDYVDRCVAREAFQRALAVSGD